MPTKNPVSIKSVASQADRRKLATFFDQHKSARFPNGRPWWGYVEMPSEPGYDYGPIGTWTPGNHEDGERRDWSSVWDAPWMPDAKWMRFDYERRRMTIMYGPMMSEYQQANEDYYAKAALIAVEKGWEAPEPGKAVSFRFRAVLGPPPQSPLIPQAAMAGDPWLLGFQQEPNEQLERILKATRYGGSGISQEHETSEAPKLLSLSQDDVDAKIAAGIKAALEAMEAERKQKKVDSMAKARAAKNTQAPQSAAA